MTTFTINGQSATVDLPDETPLLWIIREHLKLSGTKYGCGISQCGACTVLVNGAALRSCVRPLSSVQGAEIITIEGLHPEGQHPLQESWVAQQVPQCGYCQSGAILQAADLLNNNPNPGDAGKVISESRQTHTASYTTEFNIHAPLEPVNAIVEFMDGKWHAWAGNQNQSTAVRLMAQALGVDLSEVVIHQYYLGGGFGKRLACDYIVVAALTAKAVGKPVKIIYTREQDTQFDIGRSPSLQVVRGALDNHGRLTAVTHAHVDHLRGRSECRSGRW